MACVVKFKTIKEDSDRKKALASENTAFKRFETFRQRLFSIETIYMCRDPR